MIDMTRDRASRIYFTNANFFSLTNVRRFVSGISDLMW